LHCAGRGEFRRDTNRKRGRYKPLFQLKQKTGLGHDPRRHASGNQASPRPPAAVTRGHLLRTQLTAARFRFRHARCREADSAWGRRPLSAAELPATALEPLLHGYSVPAVTVGHIPLRPPSGGGTCPSSRTIHNDARQREFPAPTGQPETSRVLLVNPPLRAGHSSSRLT